MGNSSAFLYHESCPSCGSSDALAVYDDGHQYCFSCKYYVKAQHSQLINQQFKEEEEKNKKNNNDYYCDLPGDFTADIPPQGIAWLQKYGLHPKDIVVHRIGWSPNGFTIARKTKTPIQYSPLLILPVFDVHDNLLMWQARYFGSEERRAPKYWTQGNKENVLHILGRGDRIVLVEDLISAIRLSKLTAAIPMWGSTISSEIAVRLSKSFSRVCIWLDKDKTAYAETRAKSLKFLFETVDVIHSECDPKEYNDETLLEFLNFHDIILRQGKVYKDIKDIK